MGYVKFTESIGNISKTYEFESYEDFKDWENKLTGVVVSCDDVILDADIWIKNTGEFPPKLLDAESPVEVKFVNGKTSPGQVCDFYGWNSERINLYFIGDDDEENPEDWRITHYRVVSK